MIGPIQVRKQQIRQTLRQRRDKLSVEEIAQRSAQIIQRLLAVPVVAQASVIYTYVSVGSEVDTRLLIEHCWDSGVRVMIPVLSGRNELELFEFTAWSQVVVDAYGRCSPTESKRYRGDVPVTIVPGLAFDQAGGRIGSGYGHYDRFLAAHATTSIGLAYDCQLHQALPTEPHDQMLDYIITESSVYGPLKA